MTSQGQLKTPVWIADADRSLCAICLEAFTLVKSKHHCRACGDVFCEACSSKHIVMPHYGYTKAVRVCNPCFVFQRSRQVWCQEFQIPLQKGSTFNRHMPDGIKQSNVNLSDG
jgi:hypothetical protein